MMPMVVVKSVLAGIAAVIVAAILGIVILAVMSFALLKNYDSRGIGAVSFGINQTVFWISAALIFVAGFWWEFQRASK